jgi:hypothetical protein
MCTWHLLSPLFKCDDDIQIMRADENYNIRIKTASTTKCSYLHRGNLFYPLHLMYIKSQFRRQCNSVSWSLTTCFGHKWPSSGVQCENCHTALIFVMRSRISCKIIKLHILPVLGVVEVWVFNSVMHFLSVCRGSFAIIFLALCCSVRAVWGVYVFNTC